MILVDTSVWIAHFRKGGSGLAELLSEALVLVHPFVVGDWHVAISAIAPAF